MPGVLALSACLIAARVQAVPEPAAGVFLVARPSIDGGPFYHSVVLLLAHGDEGTLGVIVNRITDIPLKEALPDLGAETEGHELFFGGPVALDGLLFVFRSEETPKSAVRVMDRVHFSGDKELLDRLLTQKLTTNELHLYLGHAGWAAGQLANEIARGDWVLVRADAFKIFQSNPEKLWEELTSEASSVVADVGAEEGGGSPTGLEPPQSAVGVPDRNLADDEGDVVVEGSFSAESVESREQRSLDLLRGLMCADFQ